MMHPMGNRMGQNPCGMGGQAMNPIIRSDSSPRFAMLSTLGGAAVSIVLDPMLFFVLLWGIMGTALAAVLGTKSFFTFRHERTE